MFVNKQNIISFFINIFASFIFCFFYTLINSSEKIEINSTINNLFHINLIEKIKNFISTNFNKENASFIKLLIFNEKDDIIKFFYKDLINLSIIHLIVISGFHLSFIPKLFSLFIKNKKVLIPLNIIIMLFLNLITNFSFSAFRAFSFYLFNMNNKTKKNKYYLSILLTMIIAPFSCLNISFQMTYISIIGISIISKLKIKNCFLKYLLSSILPTMFLLPWISFLSNRITIWFPIYSFLFSPIFLFTYFSTIIFMWIPSYEIIFNNIFIFIKLMVSTLSYWNIYIPLIMKNTFLNFLYLNITYVTFSYFSIYKNRSINFLNI